MKENSLKWHNRLLITQLLSIIFAIISVIHLRLVLAKDLMCTNTNLFFIEILALIILFTILIVLFLDDKWVNIFMISIPYLIYWFIVLWNISKRFPTYGDPKDYGMAIEMAFVTFYQWVGILIANFFAILIKRIYFNSK